MSVGICVYNALLLFEDDHCQSAESTNSRHPATLLRRGIQCIRVPTFARTFKLLDSVTTITTDIVLDFMSESRHLLYFDSEFGFHDSVRPVVAYVADTTKRRGEYQTDILPTLATGLCIFRHFLCTRIFFCILELGFVIILCFQLPRLTRGILQHLSPKALSLQMRFYPVNVASLRAVAQCNE